MSDKSGMWSLLCYPRELVRCLLILQHLQRWTEHVSANCCMKNYSPKSWIYACCVWKIEGMDGCLNKPYKYAQSCRHKNDHMTCCSSHDRTVNQTPTIRISAACKYVPLFAVRCQEMVNNLCPSSTDQCWTTFSLHVIWVDVSVSLCVNLFCQSKCRMIKSCGMD